MKRYTTYSEEELMTLVCDLDEELAFRELYRRHVRLLVHTAIRKTGSKAVAEDLVQETFVKFWLGRHKCGIQKNLQAYLAGMLRHGIISHYHHQQRQTVLALEEGFGTADHETEDYLDFNTLNELYEQSLLKLPEKCREVFVMSRRGHTLREIALELQISEKTVEAHISKALRILRVEMKDYIAFALLTIPFM